MNSKVCSKCKAELPPTAFYGRSGGGSLHSACKECERTMARDWYERNRDCATAKVKEWRTKNKDRVKAYRLENRERDYRQEVVRKYGVTPRWFDEQMTIQNGACACCLKRLEFGSKLTAPHVDHCHKTMSVRGILCNRCNSILGLCGDSGDLLSTLVRYLEKCHG